MKKASAGGVESSPATSADHGTTAWAAVVANMAERHATRLGAP
jgi:hypothetical protein